MNPSISVIIPVYNGVALIGRAIASVTNQTWRDLEIIVVDDGSVDETAAVVKATGDPRLTYIYQENRGPNAARNNGMRQARGALLAFLDCDDWWEPQKLELQMARLRARPDAGLVYCAAQILDDTGRLVRLCPAELEGWGLDRLLMDNLVAGSASSVLIPRRVFDDVGTFDERLRQMEDWDMWLRIAARFPLVAVQDTLVSITDRPGSNGKNVLAMRDGATFVLEKAFSSYAAHRSRLRRACLARIHYRAGAGLLNLGLVREARRELVTSLRLDPRQAPYYWRLAVTFLGARFDRTAHEIKAAGLRRIWRWRHGVEE